MNELDSILKSMTFQFFGNGKHKVDMETLLATKDAVFLDVRSREEWESVQIKLEHHIKVMWIPIDEIPARYNEIPNDVLVGTFCTAGTRSTIVYAYLRSKGYENVKITPSNYEVLTSLLLPGKLCKFMTSTKIKQNERQTLCRR